ncbi:MAG: PDZ domain-containing protein, partial [Clostridia bacterium]|nr:PDZ domain-containing protein [Clostridia bacterium]
AEHRGALVLAVEAGSPAEAIGLRALDVITDWNGREIRCAADLSGEEEITAVRVLRKQKAVELKEE